jgi:hypothetical protein
MLRALLAAVLALPSLAVPGADAVAPSPQAGALEDRAALPVRFEANAGQLDPEARFVARTGTSALFLTHDGAVFVLSDAAAVDLDALEPARPRLAAVRMRLDGASPAPRVEGVDRLPGVTNYMLGDDPSAWRTGVVSYSAVRYAGVYEGVDVVYYANGDRLEYDFVVAPGADPASVRMRFTGAEAVDVDASGALCLTTPVGVLRHEVPSVYQVAADGTRRVAGRYVARGGGEVGFEVGAYDPSLALVVDPVLAFSSFVGGTSRDYSRAIAVSGSSIYVAGFTLSADFPTREPVQTYAGGLDVFVTRMDESSATPEFSTYVGGAGTDCAIRLALDADDNVWVAGYTTSPDFPLRSPIVDEARGYDAFAFKLDASGGELLSSTYLGGSSDDYCYGVAVDAAGNVYLAGATFSDDFPTAGPVQAAPGGVSDAFVAKLDGSGGSLVYATYLGGEGDDSGVGGIAVDATGAAYVAGRTSSIRFPTVNPIQTYFGLGDDAFVAKLDPSGAALAYSTYLGGEYEDVAVAIAVDAAGAAYVAGHTKSATFPPARPGARHGEESDAFVLKLAPGGAALAYAFAVRTDTPEVPAAIAVDPGGNAWVVGSCSSPQFPVASPVQVPGEGLLDAFVMMVDAAGSSAAFSTRLGGRLQDAATGVALGPGGDVFVTGLTASVDFPAKAGYATALRGVENAFVVRIGPEAGPAPPAILAVNATGSGAKFKVTVKGSDFRPGAEVYLAGDLEPWARAKVKRTKIKLSGGAELEAKLPPGAVTRIRVVNLDGGVAYGSIARP